MNSPSQAVNGTTVTISPRPHEVPLGQWVRNQLCELIVEGYFAPGEAIRESRVAELLGTSRVPVREALQRLADDGWVERTPRAGARVRVPESGDIEEIYGLRRVLEMEAVRLGVRHISLEDADQLRAIVYEGLEAYEGGDSKLAVDTNSRFHFGVAKLAGSDLLYEMLEMLDRRIRWLFGTIAIPRGNEAMQEHLDLVEAMLERDVDKSVEIISEHVKHTAEFAIQRWHNNEQRD